MSQISDPSLKSYVQFSSTTPESQKPSFDSAANEMAHNTRLSCRLAPIKDHILWQYPSSGPVLNYSRLVCVAQIVLSHLEVKRQPLDICIDVIIEGQELECSDFTADHLQWRKTGCVKAENEEEEKVRGCDGAECKKKKGWERGKASWLTFCQYGRDHSAGPLRWARCVGRTCSRSCHIQRRAAPPLQLRW